MPIEPTKRTRRRRASKVTPAQLEWLTGIEQPGANEFERLGLWNYAHNLERIDAASRVLDQFGELAPEGRGRKLRDEVDAARIEHKKRFPRHERYVGKRE